MVLVILGEGVDHGEGIGTESAMTGWWVGVGARLRTVGCERCRHLGCLLRELASATRLLSNSAWTRGRRSVLLIL